VSNKVTDGDQAAAAANALAVKEAGASAPHHPASEDSASEAFQSVPRPDYPPSGAFDAEGHRPVLERSRKER
jgi:hypothetical protein